MKKEKRSILSMIILIFLTFICMLPMLMVLLNSFKTHVDIIMNPLSVKFSAWVCELCEGVAGWEFWPKHYKQYRVHRLHGDRSTSVCFSGSLCDWRAESTWHYRHT